MKNKFALANVIIISLILQACASGSPSQLKTDLAKGPVSLDKADVRQESVDVINQSTELTAKQKKQLKELQSSTCSKLDNLTQESLKLRSVLIKNVVSSTYNAKETAQIKKQMHKIENKRLNVIFGAVENANKILGRYKPHNEDLVIPIFERQHGIPLQL